MKALLKNFEWVDIDTTYIFDNQYNTKTGKRIFDADIIRIEDDIRILNPEICNCGYCEKLFLTKEEYEKHIAEENNKARKRCKECWWHSVYRETESKRTLLKTVFYPNGTEKNFYSEEEMVSYTDKGCRHIPEYKCCEHEEHSLHEMRDHKKDYFVRHPYGTIFEQMPTVKIDNMFKSWVLIVNLEDLSWKLKNIRTEFTGITEIKGDTASISHIDCGSNKTLLRAYSNVKPCILRHLKNVRRFNAMVSDDRYYTSSTGKKLSEVVINNKLVKRPTPINTKY